MSVCRVYMGLSENTLYWSREIVWEKLPVIKKVRLHVVQKIQLRNSVSFYCVLFCRLISSSPSQVNTVPFLLPDTFHFINERPKGVHKRGTYILDCS
jgi:hypothetical protein